MECNRRFDEGKLDKDMPPPPLNFAYWLHRQGIDPVERFATDADMRMLHGVQLYRVEIQKLKVWAKRRRDQLYEKMPPNLSKAEKPPVAESGDGDKPDWKAKDAAREERDRKLIAKRKKYLTDGHAEITDEYNKGYRYLDLVYKRMIGRWLYKDTYDRTSETQVLEDQFLREMRGRFTGGYAHALERQRNLHSGKMESVYDGAGRYAADKELERVAEADDARASNLDTDEPSGHKGIEEVIQDINSGATFEGGQAVAPVMGDDTAAPPPAAESPRPPPPPANADKAPEDNEDNDDLRSVLRKKVGDADELMSKTEREAAQTAARKEQVANGTLTIFRSDADYTVITDWETVEYTNPPKPCHKDEEDTQPSKKGKKRKTNDTASTSKKSKQEEPENKEMSEPDNDDDVFNPMDL